MLEKILLKRLLPFSEKHNIIPDQQLGFRNKHFITTHQLFCTVDLISLNMESKHYYAAFLFNEAQVNDRVWHNGLLTRLKNFFPLHIIFLLTPTLKIKLFQFE